MAIQLVTPGDEPPTLNMLLYGVAGSGKTVGASSAPGPVLYVNAERPNATRFAHRLRGDQLREVAFEGVDTMREVVLYLREAPGVETVVVDPVGEAHRILMDEASGRAIRPKIQEYGDTAVHLERFCRALCDLPVNAVFVAHETATKDEEAGGFERLPWTGTTNPAFGAKLMTMVDVVAYCGVVPGEGEDAPPRYMGQLVTANGRRGKDRTGALGKVQDLNLAAWVELAANHEMAEVAA